MGPTVPAMSNQQTNRRWFGRDPALVLQAIAALLALVVGFKLPGLSDVQAGAIMAVLTAGAAAWTAFYVRPLAPTIFGGLISAGTALVAAYGFHAAQAHTAALTAAVAMLVAMVTRPQQDYQDPVGDETNSGGSGLDLGEPPSRLGRTPGL